MAARKKTYAEITPRDVATARAGSPFKRTAANSKFAGDPQAVRAKKLAAEIVARSPPPNLSNRIRVLRSLMDQHDRMEAKIKPVAEAILKERERILNEFTTDEISTTTAHGLRVTKKRTTSPRLVDFKKFIAYVTKRKAWDLLQKSVSSPGWRERAADGVAVPGVEAFNNVSIAVQRV